MSDYSVEYQEVDMWDGLPDSHPSVALHHHHSDTELAKVKRQKKKIVEERNALKEENEYFRKLLDHHQISLAPKSARLLPIDATDSIPTSGYYTSQLPYLPTEIILRILCFALSLPHPVIDPLSKVKKSHLTKVEQAEQKTIPVHLLTVSKTFQSEGQKILFSQNDLVFTQAFALKNFVKSSFSHRLQIQHITLRIIAQYFDDDETVVELGGYHRDIASPKVQSIKRVRSRLPEWNGTQSYCWRQIVDFISELREPQLNQKSFPQLKSMRVDLVNFLDELPGLGVRFRKVAREKIGAIVDELFVRGLPLTENCELALSCFRFLVKDGGCYAMARPAFFGKSNHLESLVPYDHRMRLKNAAKVKPKLKGEKVACVFWKEVPTSFEGFQVQKLQFDVNSGFALDDLGVTEDLYIDAGEDFDEDNEINHDIDMSDNEAAHLYGPDLNEGGWYFDEDDYYDSWEGCRAGCGGCHC